MNLQRVPVDYWNEVLSAYIDTAAMLEVRTVKLREEAFSVVTADKDVVSPETHWPVAERFELQVQDRIANPGGVDEVCGQLCRIDAGRPGPRLPARLAWDDRFVGWSSSVGEDDRHLVVLCGNVLRSVRLNDRLPLMYEWDRPDAPKDTENRRWMLGPRTPELVDAFMARLA